MLSEHPLEAHDRAREHVLNGLIGAYLWFSETVEVEPAHYRRQATHLNRFINPSGYASARDGLDGLGETVDEGGGWDAWRIAPG
jgi:hypothetical protein